MFYIVLVSGMKTDLTKHRTVLYYTRRSPTFVAGFDGPGSDWLTFSL